MSSSLQLKMLVGLMPLGLSGMLLASDPPGDSRWISIGSNAQKQQVPPPATVRPALEASAEPLTSAVSMGSQRFTVIGLPDTQNYSELYPEIFYDQTAWVVEQRYLRNILYANHYGDVVQHADILSEWEVGDTAMLVLDLDGLPYGINAGNHDVTANGVPFESYIPENYVEFFGPQRYAGLSWYRGASPSGMSSYQVIEGGGIEFLMLQIECDGPRRELEWGQAVLDNHRDKPVMMTTHRYMQDAEDYTGGVPLVDSGRYPDIWYTFEDVYSDGGLRSNEIWDWFVRRNPQIFMVNCGHFHEEFRQQSTNIFGNTVHEVLADYQDDPNGGNGWLRIMEFDVANARIDVDSYSPWLDQYRSADESQFTLGVDFATYASENPVACFQQGINGYEGTSDTWIDEANPNTAYGDDSIRESDDDTTNSIFTDSLGQALIKFDDLFGGESGDGPIPPGSEILNAVLSLQISEDTDSLFFSPTFLVYEMNREWAEDSTWNSLGNGVSGSELGAFIVAFSGDNDPDSDGLRRIDLTQQVRNWLEGTPNHGIAILPEIIAGNDDGISIWSSEKGNKLFRPRLEVTYSAPDSGIPEDFNGDGAVNGSDMAQLLASWGLSGPTDLNGDGTTSGPDLARLLAAWTG